MHLLVVCQGVDAICHSYICRRCDSPHCHRYVTMSSHVTPRHHTTPHHTTARHFVVLPPVTRQVLQGLLSAGKTPDHHAMTLLATTASSAAAAAAALQCCSQSQPSYSYFPVSRRITSASSIRAIHHKSTKLPQGYGTVPRHIPWISTDPVSRQYRLFWSRVIR